MKSSVIPLLFALPALALFAGDPPPPASLTDALTQGKLSLYARLRWEDAAQSNLKPSDAFTLGTRVGFTSAPWAGWQGMVEGENVVSLGDPDHYNAAGTNPGGAGRTVIGDPGTTDLNQAWLSFGGPAASLKVGRQRIALDNQRFIGDSGWRQNQQTYDAATLTAAPAPAIAFSYSFVSRVSRVFGNRAPQPDFTGRSHLLHASYAGLPAGTLSVYAYLLDFDNAAANSSDTFGASFSGTKPVAADFQLGYRAEYATQQDAGKSPVNYRANYYLLDLSGASRRFNLGAGYEVMGSDGGAKGFATPLASLHAFDGWADLFTATPAKGLRDLYASAGCTLPGALPLKVVYHAYRSDQGALSYGNEWDAVVTRKLAPNWTVMAKIARYRAGAPYFDTDKFWLQTEFVY